MTIDSLTTNIDCLIKILSHLSVRDRQNCCQVNSIWKTSSDHLAIAQKQLTFVSKYQSHRLKCEDTTDTIVWSTNFIKYNSYCELISKFPNLRKLGFIGFDHWNDPLINHLVHSCPALTTLKFVSCDGLGRNRTDDFFYMNVTDNGWQRLISSYGQQLTKLVLQDCDLDDKQLDIIVNGFRKLVYLDITGNHIRNSDPLILICETIEVMKLGPRLINGNNVSIELPLNALIAGNGRRLKELHIQFFLTRQLNIIPQFVHLKRLVVKFIKPLFRDMDLEFFTSISTIKTLECLEIFEYNSNDGIMSLTYNQLIALIRGCIGLKKLVINCDVWCDSIISDSVLSQLTQYNKQLNHLSLCPGNFSCSDLALDQLAKLPLKVISFTAFPGFTEFGFINLIRVCKTINNCYLEDCFEITQTFIQSLISISKDNPIRYLSIQFSESKISAKIPKNLPNNLKIIIKKNNDKSKSDSQLNSSNNNLFNLNIVISILTFISGLIAITFTLIVYLIHLLLSKIISKLSRLLLSSLLTTISLIPMYFSRSYVVDVYTQLFRDNNDTYIQR